jgi:hypothetical protein
MAGEVFDDSVLDDEQALRSADTLLRRLAESGARVRREVDSTAAAVAGLEPDGRPRAMVVAGADSRLLRAVLEPWCPVPFVAWPGPGLPGWTGALDVVVVLAPTSGEDAACPAHAPVVELAAGRETTVLPTVTDDSLAVAVAVLVALHRLGLGPEVEPDAVAVALDEVAVACSPFRDLAGNPAKELAIVLADATPLVWGGSVLAARAARRIAEALRRASGRTALAADADHLLPVLAAAAPTDPFADPFAEGAPAPPRPALVLLDDEVDAPVVREQRGRLVAAAQAHGVRVHTLTGAVGGPVARYGSLLTTGAYAAAYLGVGLGRPAVEL